jgi:quinol monooxygenase YgiN
MLIVSGRIWVRSGSRERFLALSAPAIAQARGSRGCLDFVVAPDPLEMDRVNVYEEGETELALLAFRDAGPSTDLSEEIVRAQVARHTTAASGRP